MDAVAVRVGIAEYAPCHYSIINQLIFFLSLIQNMLTIPELKGMALRLLLLCLSPVTASAQPFCTVRTFTIRDGLSANVVTSADQTGSGMMWFATWNGLCCYDGYSFLSFRDAWGDQEKLTTNRINTIATSANNNVWLLNYDRQAALFDTHTNKFVDVTGLIEKQYGRQLEVEAITPLPNGHTWVMGERSYSDIYRIDDSRVTDGEGIEHYKFADPRLKGCTVIKVRLDRHGREWLVTTKGVQQAGGRMVLAGRYDLYGEAGGSVFFASVHGRVAMVKGKGSKAVPLAMPKGVANVYCLTHSGNTILLGTNVGVVAYDTRTGKTRLMSVQTPAQPLKDVRWMYADSRQRLWVFNDTKGVVMLDLRSGSARWMHAVSSNHMLKTPSTKPFVHEDSHGTLWMVPWRGTFCYYDEQKKSLVENSLNNKGFDPLSGLFIDSWFVDRQKNLWFTGQHNLSLVNFDYQRMQIVPVERGEETRALFYDSKRQLWVGTNTGAVAVYDMDGQCKGYLNKRGQLQKGFTRLTRKVYAIYEDNRHRMWIGTKGYGLFCLTPKGSLRHYKYDARDRFSISHDSVYDIYQDSRGRLWVGTHGGGLNVLDESGGKVRFISHRNIKTNYDKDCYRVRRITSMRNGVMLVATTNGLVTFSDNPSNPEKIRFYCSKHVMGDTTSLASNDVMQAFVTSGGRVFLATMGSGLQEVVGSNMLKDQLKVRRIKSLWLNDGMVQSMFEDHGKLWMVRGNVVNAYDLKKNLVIPFRDRIYGRQLDFTEAKPAYDPVTHRAWLGVMGGYLSAQPCKVSRNHYVPQILFTGVQHEGSCLRAPSSTSLCLMCLPTSVTLL